MIERALLLLCLTSAPALAQQQGPPQPWVDPPTAADYLQDLEGSDAAERLFAARELKRRMKAAARVVARRGGDPLEKQGARIDLADLRREVVEPAGRAVVEHRNVRRLCAELLALSGDPAALGPLRRALDAEPREGVRKHIQAAINTLEAR